MKKMKKKNFMPFMYFMVKKTTKGQNRFRRENAITSGYLLLYIASKKRGIAGSGLHLIA